MVEEGSLQLRIGGIFILLVSSAAKVFGPSALHYLKKRETKLPSRENADIIESVVMPRKIEDIPSVRLFKLFTGGLLLSVALLHLVPDATSNLGDDGITIPTTSYPIPTLMVMCGCVFVVGLELIAKVLATIAASAQVDDHLPIPPLSVLSIEGTIETGEVQIPVKDLPVDSKSSLYMRLVVLEASVSVHSLAIGFGLGTQTDLGVIRVIIIAMAFHQLFEGTCLGVMMLESKVSMLMRFMLCTIFSLALPVGIVIGLFVVESDASRYSSGFANSFAAGCLLHASLVDIVHEELTRTVEDESVYFKLYMYLGMVLGCSVMAILASWV